MQTALSSKQLGRSSNEIRKERSTHPLVTCFEQAGVRTDGDAPQDIRVRDPRLWDRLTAQGSLGLGESYMDGWWECEALDEMIHRLIRHRRSWKVERPLSWCLRSLRASVFNLQRASRAFLVGEAHYDLGNDLYRKMLDERMIYSCGYWGAGASDIDQAQRDKLELVCRKIGLKPGMRVLDIGCGWGGFCRYAAEQHGVHCVGLTISREQAALARQACEGLPVEIRLEDYRRLDERFDRIVSIGMFEHVGPKNYRAFMEVAHRSLKPGGSVLLHTIGSNESYRVPDRFISRHIFPNGHLPSIAQIGAAIEGLFMAEDLHNFGPDYDLTLRCWNERVGAAWAELETDNPRYDERFQRMWRYYLLSCAGAFRSRKLQLWQWVLSTGEAEEAYRRPEFGA